MASIDEILTEYRKLCDRNRPLDPANLELPFVEDTALEDLIDQAIKVVSKGSTLLRLSAPIILVGDIHGNLLDLIHIFQVFGLPPDRKYLFLGDYVDRGEYSVEVMTLIMSLLIKYPEHIYLLRGNHEFMHINHAYGFYQEVMSKYANEILWAQFQEFFSWLPLAAIVQSYVFCVHGGLSCHIGGPEEISKIELPIRSYEGRPAISDLVWSDPNDACSGFAVNQRGSGCLFGPDAMSAFLGGNGLKLMIRAHQCVAEGFDLFGGNTGITLFSSMAYCKVMANKCGVIEIMSSGDIDIYSMDKRDVVEWQPKMKMTYNGRIMGIMRRIESDNGECLPSLVHSASAAMFAQKARTPVREVECLPRIDDDREEAPPVPKKHPRVPQAPTPPPPGASSTSKGEKRMSFRELRPKFVGTRTVPARAKKVARLDSLTRSKRNLMGKC